MILLYLQYLFPVVLDHNWFYPFQGMFWNVPCFEMEAFLFVPTWSITLTSIEWIPPNNSAQSETEGGTWRRGEEGSVPLGLRSGPLAGDEVASILFSHNISGRAEAAAGLGGGLQQIMWGVPPSLELLFPLGSASQNLLLLTPLTSRSDPRTLPLAPATSADTTEDLTQQV